MQRIGWIALAVLLPCALALAWLHANVESRLNRVVAVPLPEVGGEAEALHRRSFVADLHADSLLWGRDLLVRSSVGHVDLPRLQEGGVALQVFGAPTRVPVGNAIDGNAADALDVLSIGGMLISPRFAMSGLLARARLLAASLDGFVQRSGGALRWVRSRADLDALVEVRQRGASTVGVFYALEGAHALEGDPANLAQAFDFGVRMIGLAHFYDNEFIGSAHGVEKGGLSELGHQLLRAMEARGVVVDLAHSSPQGIRDVLAFASKPVVVSHGGVRGTCDNQRNLSDAEVRAIAATGGVIGIGYFEWTLCGTEVEQLVAAIEYVIALVGDAHVALGSDYDGSTTVGFDTSHLPAITQALRDAGHSPERVQRVIGGKILRLLRETLPPTN
jgi:microsomal dipeptidase-like Zn-dependent dipeptidase